MGFGPSQPYHKLNANLELVLRENSSTFQTPGDKPQKVYQETRYVSASGVSRLVQHHRDGRTVEKLRNPGKPEQVFSSRNGTANNPDLNPQSQPIRVNHTEIAGEEIAGHRTVVDISDDGTTKIFRAPDLGNFVLKLVNQTSRGTFILVATEIVIGEPDPKDLVLSNAEGVNQ